MVKKGGINLGPIPPRPAPPKGQGGGVGACKELELAKLQSACFTIGLIYPFLTKPVNGNFNEEFEALIDKYCKGFQENSPL